MKLTVTPLHRHGWPIRVPMSPRISAMPMEDDGIPPLDLRVVDAKFTAEVYPIAADDVRDDLAEFLRRYAPMMVRVDRVEQFSNDLHGMRASVQWDLGEPTTCVARLHTHTEHPAPDDLIRDHLVVSMAREIIPVAPR